MDRKINTEFEPKLLNPRVSSDFKKISTLKKSQNISVVDTYLDQLNDYFETTHPLDKDNVKKKNSFIKKHHSSRSGDKLGMWVYYSWKNSLVHILKEDMFDQLITARNNPLITPQEQKKYRDMTVGVVGLSVGNSIALSIAYTGGSKHIKIADPDYFELSNLNRVRCSVTDLSLNKAVVAARQIYEVNPYATVDVYTDGITDKNVKDFFLKTPKLDLVFDEADDLNLKFHLRLLARTLEIPLVLISDSGYDAVVDIIRFDLNKDSGGMTGTPDVTIEDIEAGLSYREKLELSIEEEHALIKELIGEIKPEMREAEKLRKSGKIKSWPQLGSIVFIGGGLGAYVAKMIANKESTIEKPFIVRLTDLAS